ncbi:MAG: F0F1 ATP synthase subunit A [Chloroflexi bacterium]|nr:MAG: F0F1 ATP synthase subunit A [Chloroflexota bacterium]MBL1197113.1 F0F1 ATP synthase subunit A [Chloroflexota bacterium]NOH14408.1 F0F1 ATP synthase subunit A [Chloroflexota bacterium]
MAETHVEEKKTGWRWGVNRWILLVWILFGVWLTSTIPPARPAILLKAEPVIGSAKDPLFTLPVIGDFWVTNTLVAMVLADIVILILVFLFLRPYLRRTEKDPQAPRGIANFLEGLLEVLYNLTQSTAGKWTRVIFPWFASITLLVLVMNWMALIPGVDSIGTLDVHHFVEVYVEDREAELVSAGLPVDHHALEIEAEHRFEEICHNVDIFDIENVRFIYPATSDGTGECAVAVVPWVRAVATDLNFTIALAVVSVVMIQVVGVRALGLSYFEKFFYVRTLFTKPFFGAIDFAVGLFEIVSELSKIISFSFRLFGNIFAGAVLLFVLGTLIPVVAQAFVLILEFGVGFIQALVFGMLTMVFMAQATHSHHGDGEEHH